MDPILLKGLESIVGEDQTVTKRESMLNYLSDESPAVMEPKPASDVVLVRPKNANEVAAIVKLANQHRIPVFPRGGGTGLVGGAVPTRNGIVLSLERLNLIEIDKENLMADVGAGVTLGKLIEMSGREGLSFPPHPGDENAQVGGLVATNAGGSRAVRHGVMRNHVRALEVILPSGELLHLGGKVHKDNVGYDLMQLIIGSEGTLGIVTNATIQLYGKEGASITLVVPFADRHAAIGAVPSILKQGVAPLAIEYVERDLMERTAKHIGKIWPVTTGKYYLLIIVGEDTRDEVLSKSLRISEICKRNTTFEIFAAESAADQENILSIRSNLYTVLKPDVLDILDIVVPISKIEQIVETVEEISKETGVSLPLYGHAGDGNLHVHIMRKQGEPSQNVDELTDKIYKATMALGGVITGEHGIGKTRTEKIEHYLDKGEIELMKNIKRLFDPNNIMNPGTKITI
ncbi:MAG: FAD-binding oxidoreductase [Candidatus Bathyarchaeia archaeon]|jgi:glycolate oxidase